MSAYESGYSRHPGRRHRRFDQADSRSGHAGGRNFQGGHGGDVFPVRPGLAAYLVATGIVGWIVSKLIPKEYVASYFSSGLILGVVLWGAMNILFAVSGMATPTWSMGIGSFTVNLVSHLILGVTIVYALVWTQVKAAE